MDSGYWQSQFEDWPCRHLSEQDAAHDISIFVAWATAQTLGKTVLSGRLVVLSWHVISMTSLPGENHPQRHRSSILAAAEIRRIFAGFS